MACCFFAEFVRTPAPASSGADERPHIIGRVMFKTHRGEPAEAILGADGLWHCPQLPVLDRVLNILHAPSRTEVQDGAFGHAELQAVATWFRGTAMFGDIA
jgi:hypothetical protein